MRKAVADGLTKLELNALAVLARNWAQLDEVTIKVRGIKRKLPVFRAAVVVGKKGSKKVPFEIIRDFYLGVKRGLGARTFQSLIEDPKGSACLHYRLKLGTKKVVEIARPMPLTREEMPHAKILKRRNSKLLARWIVRGCLLIENKTVSRALETLTQDKEAEKQEQQSKEKRLPEELRTPPASPQQSFLIGTFLDLCTNPQNDPRGGLRALILDALAVSGYRFVCCYYLIAVGSAIEASSSAHRPLPRPDVRSIRQLCSFLLRQPNRAAKECPFLDVVDRR